MASKTRRFRPWIRAAEILVSDGLSARLVQQIGCRSAAIVVQREARYGTGR